VAFPSSTGATSTPCLLWNSIPPYEGASVASHFLGTQSEAVPSRSEMQKLHQVVAHVTAAIVLLLLVRSANAEVSLGEMMRKCLQLESFWALKSAQDTTGSIPNDGSSVCFGYLLAFRGLHGAVIGADCVSSQSCRRTLQFCIPEQAPDTQILSAFIAYAGSHVAQWPEGAAVHYLTAMREAFPCKDAR
jgi:hypothetical protein